MAMTRQKIRPGPGLGPNLKRVAIYLLLSNCIYIATLHLYCHYQQNSIMNSTLINKQFLIQMLQQPYIIPICLVITLSHKPITKSLTLKFVILRSNHWRPLELYQQTIIKTKAKMVPLDSNKWEMVTNETFLAFKQWHSFINKNKRSRQIK